MRRRAFIAALGGVAAVWPRIAMSQSVSRVHRVGVLISGAIPQSFASIESGLRDYGWIKGQNLIIDYRILAGTADEFRASAADLVSLAPEVILAVASPAVSALRPVAGTIPIVFVQAIDPVGQGFVVSYAHPGGTITGFTSLEFSISGKWLELLKQIAPGVTEIGLLLYPGSTTNAGYLASLKTAAPSVGVTLAELPVQNDSEIDGAVAALAATPGRGLFVLPDPFSAGHRERIIAAMQRVALPAVYWDRSFVELGGLASYGVNIADNLRRATDYIDRILKGAKPADLPVQAPTKYDLVINLKTAKTLGLTIPQSLIVQADQVIE